MGRKADLRRACAKDKEKENTQPQEARSNKKNQPLELKGCPVPEPIHCLSGSPFEEDEEGRKFICTNGACPFKTHLVHDRCFGAYEDHLVKILSNLGSARGWTDSQRRANLWEKKGQSLVGKLCRCRCGAGNISLDDRHDIDRKKRERELLEQQNGQKKKKTKKECTLPKLNAGGVKGASPYTADVHRKLRRQLSESESEMSYAGEFISARRDSSNNAYFGDSGWSASKTSSDRLRIVRTEPPAAPSLSQLHYQQAAAAHPDAMSDAVDDTLSVFSSEGFEKEKLEPAPPPAPLTKSFAAAAKKTSVTSVPPASDKRPVNVPLSVLTDLNSTTQGQDSGIEMRSGKSSSMSDSEHPASPPSEQKTTVTTTVQLPPTPLSTKAAKRAAKEAQRRMLEEYSKASQAQSVFRGVPKDLNQKNSTTVDEEDKRSESETRTFKPFETPTAPAEAEPVRNVSPGAQFPALVSAASTVQVPAPVEQAMPAATAVIARPTVLHTSQPIHKPPVQIMTPKPAQTHHQQIFAVPPGLDLPPGLFPKGRPVQGNSPQSISQGLYNSKAGVLAGLGPKTSTPICKSGAADRETEYSFSSAGAIGDHLPPSPVLSNEEISSLKQSFGIKQQAKNNKTTKGAVPPPLPTPSPTPSNSPSAASSDVVTEDRPGTPLHWDDEIDWSVESVTVDEVEEDEPPCTAAEAISCASECHLFADAAPGEYHLFAGWSLFIGEKIIAMHLLPGGAW